MGGQFSKGKVVFMAIFSCRHTWIRHTIMSRNRQKKEAETFQESGRFQAIRAQIEKNRAFFSVRSLLFTTLLLVVSAYALISWMQTQLGAHAGAFITVIKMGSMALIFIAIYFVITDYMFRKRPEDLRLFHRFIWYVSILVIVAVTGLFAFIVS